MTETEIFDEASCVLGLLVSCVDRVLSEEMGIVEEKSCVRGLLMISCVQRVSTEEMGIVEEKSCVRGL